MNSVTSTPADKGFGPGWLASWVLLTVYFLAPSTEAMSWSLDSSNYGSYAWMTRTGKQFGTEVIAMTGPLGFLSYGTTYSGNLFMTRFWGDLALKAAFAALTLALAQRQPFRRRWTWLGAIVLILPNVGDLFADFALLTATLWLLTSDRARRSLLPDLLAVALLGVMGLMKGTNVLTAGAALAALIIQGTSDRRWIRTAAIVLGAGTVFIAGWVWCGQSLSHVPAYLRGVWELATGYNEAMGLPAAPRDLVLGLAIAAGLTLLFALQVWRTRLHPGVLVSLLFLAGFSFLKWKHGFVRADGHVFIFFNFAVLILPAIAIAAAASPSIMHAWAQRPSRVLTLTVLALALFGASEARWGRLGAMFINAPVRLARNLDHVASPEKVRREREAELDRNRVLADLPQVRAEVGPATIDFFGYEQGVLMLNQLNYRPRPMGGGSFNVYTRYLQEANLAFVQNAPLRPEFQLVKLQSIDDRLPAADDAGTLRALPYLYEPVRVQRDYLLLQQRSEGKIPPLKRLSVQTIQAGEIVVPPTIPQDHMLLWQLEAKRSPIGHLQNLLLRPPGFFLSVRIEGETDAKTFRLAPGMAAVPVVLSPLLEDNRDLLALYGADRNRRVTAFSLMPETGYEAEYTVTFYSTPLPPATADERAQELLVHLENPLYNRTPLEVVTEETGIRVLYDEPIALVHAPGHLDFALSPGDQQVIFSYGLMPQSYDPGRTKGVEFRVERIATDGTTTLLFSRLLEPVTRDADRGMQWTRVYLPPDVRSDDRLRLRTTTGPSGDGAWAQAYFNRVQIKTGPADPRQLSGFSVSPLAPGFANHVEHEAFGRTVRAFHPPALLVFPIPNGARVAAIVAGLQAAATDGDAQSDGITVEVSMEAPGQPTLDLGRKRIDPRGHPLDRGPQAWIVQLPDQLPAGAHLHLQATAGPAGDDRWDWGFLQTVAFQ
jgi:hypothetical protein